MAEAMTPGWLGGRRGPWLGARPSTPAPKPEPPKAAQPPAPPPSNEDYGYGVPYLPVRCPRCNRGDRVNTYSTRTTKSPPTRYHSCSRCDFKFRSHEVEEDDDGRLKLRK